MLFLDKLREHILRIHAKNNPTKNTKRSKTNIKEESSEPLREDESIEYHNVEDIHSTEEKDCSTYLESKSIQSDDELPDVDLKEASSKPKFKPKVPPTDYERFIYKCQYCMLGFKRRGKGIIQLILRYSIKNIYGFIDLKKIYILFLRDAN